MCDLMPNYGFKLQLVTEAYYRRVSFSTREYDNVSNHPVLECPFASIETQGPATSCRITSYNVCYTKLLRLS